MGALRPYIALLVLALALACRGADPDGCPADACLTCLRHCWDRSSSSRGIVRDLSGVLPASAEEAHAIGVCSSAEDTAAFLRSARAVVRAHRSSIGVGKVWGLGLHGSHFWVAFYACARSSANRGQCNKASLALDHGFFLVECPGRRVCKLDTAQIDSRQLPQLVSACLQSAPPRARSRRLAGGPGHVPDANNASAQGAAFALGSAPRLHAPLGRRLDGAAAAPGQAPFRQRQWDCAARALAAQPAALRAEGGWTIYPQRSTRRSTFARFLASKLVAFRDASDGSAEVTTTLVPVTTYAVADLLQDGCFGARRHSAPCHAVCSPCRSQTELLHQDACANSTAPAGATGRPRTASHHPRRPSAAARRAAWLALRTHWPARTGLSS